MRRSIRTASQTSLQLSKSTAAMTSPSKNNGRAKSPLPVRSKPTRKRPNRESASDDSESDFIEQDEPAPQTKKRKTARSKTGGADNAEIYKRLFGECKSHTGSTVCSFPDRRHSLAYHRPLLLDDPSGRALLLGWFDSVSTARSMPWRKAWIDPRSSTDAAELRQQLERRAYEVWISEIMLQQTRVAVVIDYWNRWTAKWPTIHDLAAAEPDDVLAAWRGLGYYSRATRIHEAAKLVCGDPKMRGLLPAGVDELAASIPGVGKYTAGAISAIVFGRAAPMVDGNVLRVLSRQLGLLGDVKTDKAVIDMLWAAAGALVKAVASDSEEVDRDGAPEEQVSDRPGRWGQALMELGSTVCTPKPNCAACPVTSTCQAYKEGRQLAVRKGLLRNDGAASVTNGVDIGDIEDACTLCSPLEAVEGEDEVDIKADAKTVPVVAEKAKPRRQATLQSFAFTQSAKVKKEPSAPSAKMDTAVSEMVANHARKFPVKTIKKAVREEETLVCAVRRSDGRYLIHRRPEKGLLAGLWEFPSHILPDPKSSTAKTRKQDAVSYVSGLVSIAGPKGASKLSGLKHVGALGSVPWLFSHIKLTMHVHLFELDGEPELGIEKGSLPGVTTRWSDAVDEESMGTGMMKCWALAKDAMGD